MALLQDRLRRRETLERRVLLLIARRGMAGVLGFPLGARRCQPLGLALLPLALGDGQLLGIEHHHLGVFFGERVGVLLLELGLGLRDLLGGLLPHLRADFFRGRRRRLGSLERGGILG